MTEALVHFDDRFPVPRGSACEACGSGSMLGHDHCHKHGWVRGIACMSCNQYLGSIDRLLSPWVKPEKLAALLAIRNRCPDCDPLAATDLEPPGRRARENRRRKLAERQQASSSPCEA